MYCEEHAAAGMVSKILRQNFLCVGRLDVSEAGVFRACSMSRTHADWPCILPPMQVNLIAGRCEHEGCNIIAWYSYPGENSRFCNRHKLHGMVSSQRPLHASIAACACNVTC